MHTVDVVSFFTQALYLVLWLSLPPIIVGSVVGTLFTVLISAMAGYVLIQRGLPFRKAIATGILITMMIPGDLTLVSIFSLNKALGLIDSYQGLIVNGLVSSFSMTSSPAALIHSSNLSRLRNCRCSARSERINQPSPAGSKCSASPAR